MESNFRESHYPFCFQVHATLWSKKGTEMHEPRDFFLASESELDMTNWVFRLSYQIDFYKLQDQSKQASHEPKLDVYKYGQESEVGVVVRVCVR
jgi:hypothetical protein